MPKNNNTLKDSWFDTPFYHILYKNRDYKEAEIFSTELIKFLDLPIETKILDLACGQGRHSVNFNKMGYNVTGVDISKENIFKAKKYENNSLSFGIHDMRNPMSNKFDLIVNLFTSFGYFEEFNDNLKTLSSLKLSLNKNGVGVIDFLNINNVKNNLIHQNTEEIEGIKFNLKRCFIDGFLVKEIKFKHNFKQHTFKEKVRALTLSDFKDMFKRSKLEILHIFGDYKLNKFDINKSKRLIFIFK